MAIINMHQAKSELSDLVARAEAGEEIVIARRNKPAVKLVPVQSPDKAVTAPPEASNHGIAELDWFEHAPDDYISKEDIAAYYRKYPQEWNEMRHMVGFAEDKQAEFDLNGFHEALEAGRVFTIVRDGKPVAQVVPSDEAKNRVRGFGMLSHLPPVPDAFFFDSLPDEELRIWEGENPLYPDDSKP